MAAPTPLAKTRFAMRHRDHYSPSAPAVRLGRLLRAMAPVVLVLAVLISQAGAQEELTYSQYQALAWTAHRLDHMAQFEPLDGEPGMYFALGDRFGTVQVLKLSGRGSEQIWKSNSLGGVPQEVLTADLAGDGLDDALICRTSAGKVYVWSLDGYQQLWESLSGEYQQVACLTTANLDEDPATEIVMIADGRLVQIDGE